MPLNRNTRFSIDSSSLIHAWNRAYRVGNFPTFWKNLEVAIENGIVVASLEVLYELSKKDDGVHAWCKKQAHNLCVDLDDEQQEHLQNIMGKYPRMVDTVRGKSGGDVLGAPVY